MIDARHKDWLSVNQALLTGELDVLKAGLRRRIDGLLTQESEAAGSEQDHSTDTDGSAAKPASALDRLSTAFGLSKFERNVVLLCAGVELDSAFGGLCAAAQGDSTRHYPTFSLALAAVPEAHWSALAPNAPLRRWRLIEAGTGPSITVAPLRIDEPVLNYLTGSALWDERLAAIVEPLAIPNAGDLAPSQAEIARSIAQSWSRAAGQPILPVVELSANDPEDGRPIAAAATAALGLNAVAISSDLIPAAAQELQAFGCLWEREAALNSCLLLIECGGATEDARYRSVARFAERTGGLIVLSSREPVRIRRPCIRFSVVPAGAAERRAAWLSALSGAQGCAPARLDAIASQFSVGMEAIRSIAARAVSVAPPGTDVVAAAW
jgi:hypothetical protein